VDRNALRRIGEPLSAGLPRNGSVASYVLLVEGSTAGSRSPDATMNDVEVMAFFTIFGYVYLTLDGGAPAQASMKKNIHALLISRGGLTQHVRRRLALLVLMGWRL
jgi:hypothetical protein